LATASTAVASQVGNYMVTYAVQVLKLPAALSQGSVLMGGVMTFTFALVGGALCDRLGRRAVNLLPRLALMLLIVPLFVWLSGAPGAATLLTVTAVLAALTVALARARGLPTALRDPRLSGAGNWLAKQLTQALAVLTRMEHWLRTPGQRELTARDREILEPLLLRLGAEAGLVAELVLGPDAVPKEDQERRLT